MMYKKNLIYVIAIIAATGGLLFGFDTGVISGAIPFLQEDFEISDGMIELITASGLVGAILGALTCGKLADKIGRRKVILGAAVIFFVGALWSGMVSNTINLIFARLFLGIAIGVSSFVVPLYIAEIAPKEKRGAMVASFQLMVAVGILFSYLSDLMFADESNVECWRRMFYIGMLPAAILFIGMLFLPETPRWLLSKGEKEKSKKILSKIEPPEILEDSFSSMMKDAETAKDEKSSFKYLFQPWLRKPLFIAIAIVFFQQFVGINTVIYYSPKIFLMAGFDGAISAIWASVGIGVVNVVAAIIALSLVDKLGRRKLFTIGMVGIFISLSLLGLIFSNINLLGNAGKFMLISLVFVYAAFFSLSIGPLAWLIISEVFPQNVRGLGSSIGSLFCWLFNALVSFTFFKIVNLLSFVSPKISIDGEMISNPAGAFWLYGIIALIGVVWGYFYLPETKGVSLEDIENKWKK